MNCSGCGCVIPQARLEALPKIDTCVNCSTAQPVGAIDIIYHKTGNTIQVVDREVANRVNRSARRSGFGAMQLGRGSSKGGRGRVPVGSGGTLPRVPTQQDFEQVGQQMMTLLELGEPREASLQLLHTKCQHRVITSIQYQRLLTILDQFAPEVKPTQPTVEHEVDDEINWAFKNWRNSKIYR